MAGAILGACATDMHRPSDPSLIYPAQSDEGAGLKWDLRITLSPVRYRDAIGGRHYGEVPSPQIHSGGVTYEGELVQTAVVAGLVEESRMDYRLDVVPGPCRDRLRRTWPTRALVTFSPESRWHGCGGPMPVPGPAQALD